MADAPKPAQPEANEQAALWALIRRAESGDESVLPALRKALDHNGQLVDVVGDLAAQVERTLIRNAAGNALAFKEAALRKMRNLRADLAGPNATPVERLLADRVALCWLSLHDAEVRFAQAKDLTWKQVEFWQPLYLSAIKTLATVRKLALPALQVNIARKQVNVVSPGGD